jgi:lysophospholipase L1-like esterase
MIKLGNGSSNVVCEREDSKDIAKILRWCRTFIGGNCIVSLIFFNSLFPSLGKADSVTSSTSTAASFVWKFASERDCPGQYQIPDITCDKQVKIAVVGDSIVAGVGDEVLGKSGGGYVTRIEQLLPKINFTPFGKPGQTTLQLYRRVKKVFNPKDLLDNSTSTLPKSDKRFRASLLEADIVIFDIGRNDWWSIARKSTPSINPTFSKLRRIQSFLRGRITELTERTPIIILSRLLLPNRGRQGPWVQRLNDKLISSSSLYLPSNVPFDLVGKRLYNSDQLHLNAAGYQAAANILMLYLTSKVPKIWSTIRSNSYHRRPRLGSLSRNGSRHQAPTEH